MSVVLYSKARRAPVRRDVDASGNSVITGKEADAVYAPADDLLRAAARMAIKRAAASVIRGIVFGDSWGDGAAATNSYGYAQQLAVEVTDLQWSNYSYPSRPIEAYHFANRSSGVDISGGNTALQIQIQPTDVAVGIPGLNNLRGASANGVSGSACGANPASRKSLMSRAQAHATRMMIPEANQVRMHTLTNSGPNPLVVFDGANWLHDGINGNLNCSRSNTVGHKATLTTAYGDLLVLRYMSSAGSNGAFTLTIDGTVYGPFLNKAGFDAWVSDCLILKLPTRAVHTVVMEHVSGDWFMPEAVGCVDTSIDFGAFYVYCAPAPQSADGWAITPTMNSGRANARAVVTAASVVGTTLTIATEAAITSGQVSPGQFVIAQATGDTGSLAVGAVLGEQLTKLGPKGSGSYRLNEAALANGNFTALTLVNPAAPMVYENAGRNAFASWLEEAMNQLFRFGFNTINSRATADWDYLAYEMLANQIHPNDLGHGHLKRRKKATLNVLLGKPA